MRFSSCRTHFNIKLRRLNTRNHAYNKDLEKAYRNERLPALLIVVGTMLAVVW